MDDLEKRWKIWRKDGQSGEKMDDLEKRWTISRKDGRSREKMDDLEKRWTTDGENRWTIWRKPQKKHAGPHKAQVFLRSLIWFPPNS